MARTVGDVALFLSVLAGFDSRAPLALETPGSAYAKPLGREFKDVRIAWSRDLGGLPVDPRVTAAIDAQRATFEALGCIVEDADPDLAGADEAFKTWRAWRMEAARAETVRTRRVDVKQTVIWNVEEGAKLSGPDIGRAEKLRAQIFERMHEFMGQYEFIVCPVNQVPPFDVTTEYVTEINGVQMETYIDWMRSCSYVTVTTHPAISVPAGFTPEGLPVGLQIVGRFRDDFGVLQLANAYEGATNVWRKRPAIAE
jgi:amidase